MQQNIINVSINEIVPNKYQPRKYFDDNALKELADSIKTYGILNPILVRKKDDKYEIIAGERRFRAASQVGLKEVPVIVKDANDQQMSELALIENLSREGLTPIEEAKSYEEIIRLGNQTQDTLAKKIGKSQSYVANKIRLLSLPNEIQDALIKRKISERHARTLMKLTSKEEQIDLLNQIINEKLTVKETENRVNKPKDDITDAINEIMKTLNIKEKKEEDNMNNGNFFPNFGQTPANNVSLNSMNFESMNQPMMNNMNQTPANNNMPSFENLTNNLTNDNLSTNNQVFNQQVVEQPVVNQPEMPLFNNSNNEIPVSFNNDLNVTDQPLFTNPVSNNVESNMTFQQPEPVSDLTNNVNVNPFEGLGSFANQQSVNVEIPQTVEQPLFNMPTFNTEQNQPVIDIPLFNQQVVEQPVVNVPEMPLFNNTNNEMNVQMDTNNQQVNEVPLFMNNETNNSVATEMSVPTEQPVVRDKFTEVKELLNNNGIAYRAYSNETGNCIIIEL